MTPGGDGELLRDAIARALYEQTRSGVSNPEPWERATQAPWLQRADVAVAALRTVLREHPAAISQLGWQVRATVGAWGNRQEVLFAPPPREVQE